MAGVRTRYLLKALAIEKQKAPGLYADGGGLNFIVTDGGTKRWELRTTVDGRRRQLGLGIYPDVSLEDARRRADQIRRAGREDRFEGRRVWNAQAARRATFKEAFESFFALKAEQLSNTKHRQQWRATMETYVFPFLGREPVRTITSAQVVKVLSPIWNAKSETAKRVLQRMQAVFEAAIIRGEREAASPTVGVTAALGLRKMAPKHYAALPYCDVPIFLDAVRCMAGGKAVLALEFLILTAARSGEVRGMTWSEVDLENAVWTLPAKRMKARVVHRVPLSPRALAILRKLRPNGDLSVNNENIVFSGLKSGTPLSDMTLTAVIRRLGYANEATVHGFRSSFKNWCAEVAGARDEISEAALAHKIPDCSPSGPSGQIEVIV